MRLTGNVVGKAPFKDERERNDRHIEIEAERAIRDGLLTPRPLMNGDKDSGDWRYDTGEFVRLATGPNGDPSTKVTSRLFSTK